MNRRIDRVGYSLIELLVVIAIISLMIAMTLSAIQRIRSAALRTSCVNQIRQITLAQQSYVAYYSHFPPGVAFKDGNEPFPFMSFHVRLLPFLEQNARWEQAQLAFRSSRNFLNDPPHTGLSTAMPQFGCPLDERTRSPQLVRGKVYRGLTSYLGVEGTNAFQQDGILYLDSAIKLGQISDGASNTLIIGERPPSADHAFGWWYGGWGQDKDGEGDVLLGSRTKNNQIWVRNCPVGPYDFQQGNLKNQCDTFHFWSLHPGGANFAFADGSVRFLRYSANDILPALATRAGGEAVQIPD